MPALNNQTKRIVKSLFTPTTMMICVASVTLYYGTFYRLIKGWITFESITSLFILVVSLYIVYEKRKNIEGIKSNPFILLGAPILLIGHMILVIGKVSDTILIQDLSLIIVMLGLVSLLWGYAYFKFLLIPISYLALMFTFFDEILGNISIYLQYAAAWIASIIIRLTGTPVMLSGKYIEMPHITLEVAAACSGIHHIVALVSLAVPLAIFTQRSLIRKIMLVCLAFFVGIFANGMRVVLIAIWSMFYKGADLHGPFDIFYVSFIMVFGFFLIFLTSYFTKNNRDISDHEKSKPVKPESIEPDSELNPSVERKRKYAYGVALTIIMATFFYLDGYSVKGVTLKHDLNDIPFEIDSYIGKNENLSQWPEKIIPADMMLKRRYIDPSGDQFMLYVGYFEYQEQGKELINTRLDRYLHNDDARVIYLAMDDHEKKALPVKHTIYEREGERKSVYFWYVIDGGGFVNRYKTKIEILKNSLFKRKNNGAIVIVTKDIMQAHKNENKDYEIIKIVYPIIGKILNVN